MIQSLFSRVKPPRYGNNRTEMTPDFPGTNQTPYSPASKEKAAAILLFCLVLGLGSKGWAQLSHGGTYFGKLGAGDVVLSVGK